MQGFEVLQGGLFTTLQDLGRFGHTHLGITPSGAMDEYAYRWGQKLLGNNNANALEILLAGLKLKATTSTSIAITGADLNFTINDTPCVIWQTYNIQKGDILNFNKKISGQRSYLAVKGGFHTEQKYGSFSSTLKEQIGFKVTKGDFLSFTSSPSHPICRVPKRYIPNYNEPLTLRLLLSYQHHYFSPEQKEAFFTSRYTVTPNISRMGYKLKGDPIIPNKSDIISEGISFGAVQIPKDGQPIILLKEHQTIGGYPKIGSILPIDAFKLGQAPIGSEIQFIKIDIEEAQEKMRKFHLLW